MHEHFTCFIEMIGQTADVTCTFAEILKIEFLAINLIQRFAIQDYTTSKARTASLDKICTLEISHSFLQAPHLSPPSPVLTSLKMSVEL